MPEAHQFINTLLTMIGHYAVASRQRAARINCPPWIFKHWKIAKTSCCNPIIFLSKWKKN